MRPRLYRFEVKISGAFRGYGQGEYRLTESPGIGRGLMIIEEPWLAGFDYLSVSCTSVISVNCGNCPDTGCDSVSLLEVLGPGKVFGEAVYRIFNDSMRLIGEVEQKFETETKILDNGDAAVSIGETVIKGSCWGEECKLDVVRSSPGYIVYLRQVDDETIEGTYSQLIYSDLGKIYVLAKRLYNKKDMRSKMPFDELLLYKILSLRRSYKDLAHEVEWTYRAMTLPADPTFINNEKCRFTI